MADGIVIALNRLNKILELDPQQRIAVVEPGVVNQHVCNAAAAHGLYYAPDPSSQSDLHDRWQRRIQFRRRALPEVRHDLQSRDRQQGGPGHGRSRHDGWSQRRIGRSRLHGTFLWERRTVWRRAWKSRCVCCRSLNSFTPSWSVTDSLQAAGDAVSAVIDSGLLPGALEIMDALAIEAAEAAVACGYPPGAAAVLIVELEGARERIEYEREQLDRCLGPNRTVCSTRGG